ncbi:MAG: BON domain-containing protein, partial [Candidatus Hydrogenedentes bacterium]|nr:BON domain-containing protein [Candidatus Hydrogenedentota bacterium]
KNGEVAGETKGVRELVNNLKVRPKDSSDPLLGVGRQLSDEWLESRVETAFFLNRHLSTREIDVEVDDGICILTGSVNSTEKQAVAAQIARSIHGVQEVRTYITVRPEGDTILKTSPEKKSGDVDVVPLTLEGSDPEESTGASLEPPKVEETSLAAP